MSRHARDDKRKKRIRRRRNVQKAEAHKLKVAAVAQAQPGAQS